MADFTNSSNPVAAQAGEPPEHQVSRWQGRRRRVRDKRICLMIIQFNPSPSGRESSPDPPSGSCDSSNRRWCPPDQAAFGDENRSKIVNLPPPCAEASDPGPNYVEEIQAKRFKGESSVLLVAEGELLAAAGRPKANPTAVSWMSPDFLDGLGNVSAVESLPKAA